VIKLPAPAAAVLAKADAAADLHPFLFGALIALGGVVLFCNGISGQRRQ
jgi:hypothetical protein